MLAILASSRRETTPRCVGVESFTHLAPEDVRCRSGVKFCDYSVPCRTIEGNIFRVSPKFAFRVLALLGDVFCRRTT